MRTILVVAAVIGCGSGNTYSAKCMAACAPPASGPCATQSSSDCQSQCVAATAGLSLNCVQCIIEHSGWAGTKCTCYGSGCCTCGFGPGDNSCRSCSTSETCSTSDEQCSGFQLAKATGTACSSICIGDAGSPD